MKITRSIKRSLYRRLGMERYLRLMQSSFLLLYRSGLLRLRAAYRYHYFIRRLVRQGDVTIDIGANLGYYSLPLSSIVGQTGRVYAVEPVRPYNEVFMRAASRRSNIVLLPYALGSQEGAVTLVTSPRTGYLRTGLPHVYRSSRDGQLEEQEYRFEATMKSPVELFAGLDRIDFIKCDIEGMELEVLSLMKDIIADKRPVVQVEVWEENENELCEMFATLGYEAYKIEKRALRQLSECSAENEGDHIFIPSEKKSDFIN